MQNMCDNLKHSCYTIAIKYTLLWGIASLSLNQRFLERLCKRPQSITRSQYVEATAANIEKTQAKTFHTIELLRL